MQDGIFHTIFRDDGICFEVDLINVPLVDQIVNECCFGMQQNEIKTTSAFEAEQLNDRTMMCP